MKKHLMSRIRFVEGGEGDGGGSSAEQPAAEDGQESQEQQSEGKTFTQDEVNGLLNQQKRGFRKEIAELQSQLDGKKTLEDRFAEMEQRAAAADAKALRSDIAAKHGISAEDRDLFLTGADEETLTAQAQRLAERESDRKKQGNVAPLEGKQTASTGTDDRATVRALFGSGG